MCLAKTLLGEQDRNSDSKDNASQDANETIKTGASLYKLGKLLGRGRFGVTRAAQHCDLGHKVAVKLVKKQDFDPEELRLQRRLVHNCTLKVHEVFEADDHVCIVMDYMSGGSLLDYLQSRARLGECEVWRLFQQIIDGVEHCHTNMIVHRDIKADNILLDKNMNVKLADFGLAGEIQADKFLTRPCGSLNYAAPEMLSNECQYRGPEVDIWSCGVVFYALLTSYLPFNGGSANEVCRNIRAGFYTIPGYVSSDARDLLKKMLTVDQNARISIAGIRKHTFFSSAPSESYIFESHDKPEFV